MTPKCYRKELPDQPVWINGSPIKFNVIRTKDPVMIKNLDACIAGQRGGIIAINEAEYEEEAKKKLSGNSSDNGSPRMRQQGLSAANRNLAAVAGAESAPQPKMAMPQLGPGHSPVNGRPMPDPIMVPSPNQFSSLLKQPPTAKITPP